MYDLTCFKTLPEHGKAWGAYKFAGRVRLQDGFVVFKREPVSGYCVKRSGTESLNRRMTGILGEERGPLRGICNLGDLSWESGIPAAGVDCKVYSAWERRSRRNEGNV